MRAFIAVDFEPSDVLRGLLGALNSSRARLRVVGAENLHITLRFLGTVEESLVPSIVDVMRRSAKGIRPSLLTLIGTGAFPSLRAPRVLWVGVKGGDALVTLARGLEEGLQELGFPRERRRFSPHLTVARVKGTQGGDRIARVMEEYREESFGEQRVEDIRLKRSELTPSGPIYHEVAKVALE
ncbi:MAG: RNA 2',3'-cyclic phosphodiesterase [Thermoplasmata archaeon]